MPSPGPLGLRGHGETDMGDNEAARAPDAAASAVETGLRSVRRKRGFLWGLLLGYLPMIWLSLELTGSDRVTGAVFGAWVALVFAAVMVAAYASCPGCGKPFHLKGLVPLWVRRCVHCGQPLRAGGGTTQAAVPRPPTA